MGRTPCCDMMGIRKGPWSVEEDRKLIEYIEKHGYGNWRAIPKQAGVMRCGKSCRLRWMNYLRPNLKRGSLSSEEEQTIYRLHGILGNKWSTIASYLPGRTDNEIKNIWNTRLRKRLAQSESGKNLTHSSSPSTMPTTPAEAVNNSLPNSPPMQISHLQHDIPLVSSYSPNHNGRMERNDFVQVCQQGPYFADAHEQLLLPSIAGSPILSTSKDSADQIKLSGTKYSAGKDIIDDQRDGNSSAHDYINFLKNFLDINEESSVISPYELHQDADATFTVESHHFDNEERTLQPQKCFSVEHGRSEDHITTAVFCWNSPFSGNQFDHEILQTSFADSKVAYSYSPNSSSTNNPMSFDSKVAYSYSPNSSSTNNPMSLSLDFLVDFPEKMWRAF